MYNYYCKNCNNIVGEWNIEYKNYCNFTKSKNINSMFFLDCRQCNKFVGIKCYNVCKNCFGEDKIFGEENLFKWFQYYKIIIKKFKFGTCKVCNTVGYRSQFWYFKELTFYKQ